MTKPLTPEDVDQREFEVKESLLQTITFQKEEIARLHAELGNAREKAAEFESMAYDAITERNEARDQLADLKRLCRAWLDTDDAFYKSMEGASSPYGGEDEWKAVEAAKEALRRHLEGASENVD